MVNIHIVSNVNGKSVWKGEYTVILTFKIVFKSITEQRKTQYDYQTVPLVCLYRGNTLLGLTCALQLRFVWFVYIYFMYTLHLCLFRFLVLFKRVYCLNYSIRFEFGYVF